jgi:uncharacterized ion transporter superfamily protein YfcC
MAHSFDVFDAAGTHACSCQSNGGLARTIIKCIVKLTSVLLNPVFFLGKCILQCILGLLLRSGRLAVTP